MSSSWSVSALYIEKSHYKIKLRKWKNILRIPRLSMTRKNVYLKLGLSGSIALIFWKKLLNNQEIYSIFPRSLMKFFWPPIPTALKQYLMENWIAYLKIYVAFTHKTPSLLRPPHRVVSVSRRAHQDLRQCVLRMRRLQKSSLMLKYTWWMILWS